MIYYIKAIFKWLIRKETFSNALFAVRIAKSVFTNKESSNLKKNESILRKLEIAQDVLDKVQRFLPNEETNNYVNGINNDFNKKKWGDFSATLVKDKHGKGKNGIELGLRTKALGLPVEISFDAATGEARGKVGPFGFSL